MNFKYSWNKQKYEEFINYLKNFTNLKYKKFNSKIVNDETLEFIGVKTLILRKIAKEISKNNYLEFLNFNKHQYFEECMIHVFIIVYLKLNYSDLMNMLKNFIPYISNWALCDSAAKNYSQFIENQDIIFNEIIELLQSLNPWEVRFGLVLILNNFVNEKFIHKILEICKSIKSEYYYVKLGNAWLISECYIKFPEIMKKFLESRILDKWIQNKAIQKIKESLRISKREKELISKLKIV
ncbi:MAG: DNA alkylation repair protein [Oscillospiraceae bacterium]|jgi:3-methyladenine DNA glycosylase AlkD|nr:DNA alkylation repair protein [Oscillospiraceae bacterium]